MRDMRFVHQADEFVCSHALPARKGDGTCNGTVEVLVIVDYLGGGKSSNCAQDKGEKADRGHFFLVKAYRTGRGTQQVKTGDKSWQV